MIGEENFKRF